MKNISGQYQDLLEGKMTQAQFLRNARMMFPNFVTQHNSFKDSVAILKQKGMLNEGDAVKGTPDKEPTYESPTPDVKTKYKKVEQSPEVDEQDGIYPATTLTDIPKVKVNKKVKNESDGLEPIKDNDTKNEMKKVKVVKENIHNTASMGGILGGRNYKAEAEEDKAAAFEIRDLIKSGTPEGEAIEQISEKYKLRPDYLKRKYALYVKDVKENQINEAGIAPDAKAVIDLIGKNTMLLNKLKMINNKEELQPVFDFLLTKISQTIAKNTQQVKAATTTSAQNYSKMGSVTEKAAPKLEQLITKILNETLSKKSAR